MLQLEGAFWSTGKCPICLRRYQKDIRLIWLWDTKSRKVIKLVKLCSWCFIIFFAQILKIDPKQTIKWTYAKEDSKKLRLNTD